VNGRLPTSGVVGTRSSLGRCGGGAGIDAPLPSYRVVPELVPLGWDSDLPQRALLRFLRSPSLVVLDSCPESRCPKALRGIPSMGTSGRATRTRRGGHPGRSLTRSVTPFIPDNGRVEGSQRTTPDPRSGGTSGHRRPQEWQRHEHQALRSAPTPSHKSRGRKAFGYLATRSHAIFVPSTPGGARGGTESLCPDGPRRARPCGPSGIALLT